MAEYIKRNLIIDYLDSKLDSLEVESMHGFPRTAGVEIAYHGTRDFVLLIPAADVEPVKHGKWTSNGDDWECYKCSICRNEAYWDTDYGQQLFDFCPWCGAKMDGKEVQE